jgi:enoyl-CoA hydratase/carnithine racemase
MPNSMSEPAFESALDGAVARITLARPDAHNALDQDAMRALTALLADWAGRTEIRALVLTARGRSFCAGAALGDVAGADWTENPLTALCDALEAFPAPSLAALNGGIYGGGVELALACDFRIGVTSMRAFVPPARLGIHYEPAGIARAIDRLGSQMARRMFLLAESFDAEALLAAGFLDHLVEPAALEAKSAEITGTLAGLAPLAVRGMKRTIVEIARGTLDTEAARGRIRACFASADHAEGLAAQRERRPPRFSGR